MPALSTVFELDSVVTYPQFIAPVRIHLTGCRFYHRSTECIIKIYNSKHIARASSKDTHKFCTISTDAHSDHTTCCMSVMLSPFRRIRPVNNG